MKRLTMVMTAAVALWFLQAGAALSETKLSVEEVAIATGVENRMPVGAAEKFPATVGKLYCYSKIIGGGEGSSIKHIWYRGEQKVAEIPLGIKYPSFRTYSYKTIPADWAGKWKVEITADDGTILKTVVFSVE